MLEYLIPPPSHPPRQPDRGYGALRQPRLPRLITCSNLGVPTTEHTRCCCCCFFFSTVLPRDHVVTRTTTVGRVDGYNLLTPRYLRGTTKLLHKSQRTHDRWMTGQFFILLFRGISYNRELYGAVFGYYRLKFTNHKSNSRTFSGHVLLFI